MNTEKPRWLGKSYGKEAIVLGLPGGSQMKVGSQMVHTKGIENINKTGIEPDVKVDLSSDVSANVDPRRWTRQKSL